MSKEKIDNEKELEFDEFLINKEKSSNSNLDLKQSFNKFSDLDDILSFEEIEKEINSLLEIEGEIVEPEVSNQKIETKVDVQFKEIKNKEPQVKNIQTSEMVKSEKVKLKLDVIIEELFFDYKDEYQLSKEKILQNLDVLNENLDNEEALKEVRRALHALKGGFNTIGLLKVGKEIHFLETVLTPYETSNEKEIILEKLSIHLDEVFYFFDGLEIGGDCQFVAYGEKDELISDRNIDKIELNEKTSQNDVKNKLVELNSNLGLAHFSTNKEQENIQSNQLIQKNENVSSKNSVSTKDDEQISLKLSDINSLVDMQDDFKAITTNLVSENEIIKELLKDLEENLIILDKNIKELDIYAETNIQSSNDKKDKAQFDPLIMDRFTKLQEMSRSITENFLDISDVKKNLQLKVKSHIQNTEKINELTSQSAERLTKLRLIEFRKISKRFEETHKKACRDLKKDVDLELRGKDVLVDITLSNKIRTPIEHILRNSISHGIEAEKDRVKAGKPKKGKVVLEVKQEAKSLVIQVSDDGYGLNVQKIRKKAIEKGMAKETDDFTVEDAVKYILMPNFSTADKITEISGRGVGMEAVQADILNLGGTFNITSEEGKGMMVKITIPTSFTTTYGLICKTGEEEVVILNSVIKEILSFNREDFEKIKKEKNLNYNGKNIDFRDLKDVLKIKHVNEDKMFYRVLILEDKETDFAVYVDDVISNKEILIKSLDLRIPGVIGITSLSSGKPLFVFNPLEAKRFVLNKTKTKYLTKDSFSEQEVLDTNNFFIPLILIVDDSVVIRKSSEKFLDNHGFKHISAKNGKDALEKVIQKPDLILLDIEMPEMNGFEFTEIIKQSQDYKDIPIVMITSRINPIHKEKALSLGINEYMIKPFNPDELLKHIRKYAYDKKR